MAGRFWSLTSERPVMGHKERSTPCNVSKNALKCDVSLVLGD